MASGSFCNNVSQNCNLIISWNSVKGQGGSTVNATLIAQNHNGWHFDAVVYGYGITINGSQVTGTGARLSASRNGSAGLISHSVWVPYTGGKSITISGYANFNGIINLSNQSISGTVALDKIGSAPTMGSVTAPTTSTVSEKTTSITVRWNKATSYNNSVTYAIGCSINGGSYEWRYPDNNINTTSYTWDIGTPTQGATYKFAVCCANDIARSDYKYSGVVTINKLNPPTIGDIGTYNPYTNSTLTIPLSGGSTTNDENFVRMCDLYYGDTWLCSGKPHSETALKNTSQAISYAAANYVSKLGTKAYSSNKFKITAWIENANRSRSSYASKTFTVNINSDGGATPTLSLPTLSGGAFNNAATCFIAGISTLNVSSPAASLRRAPSGTTISYKIACTGATTQNSQNASFSGLTAGKKTITVTATDSRGLSVSVSKQVVVQSYAAPTIRAFTATRLDNPNTSAKLVYTLAYSPIYQYTDADTKGNQLNGISLQQYKKDNFNWTTASNELVLTNLETDSTYTIQLRIADKVNTTTYVTFTQVIPTIKTTMAWRSWGVGIGCIPQTSYALEINGSSKISGSLNASNMLQVNSRGVGIGCIPQTSYALEINGSSKISGSLNASNMLQVNSNGVAIGKASEKSAFEVNKDTYIYGNLNTSQAINGYREHCATVKIRNTNNYPYHRVAYLGTKAKPITSSWYDHSLLLLVERNYQDGGCGICKIEFRTNNVSSENASFSLRWLVKDPPLPAQCIQVGFVNTRGASYMDVFYYSSGIHASATITKISGGDRNGRSRDEFTFLDTYENSDTTSSDKKGSKNCYKSFAAAGAEIHNGSYTQTAYTATYQTNSLEMFPVGAIYLTWNNNNPEKFLGGTWVQFGQGRTLVGVDTSDSDFNTVGKTGGSKEQTMVARIGAFDNDISAIGYLATGNPGGAGFSYGIRGSASSNISGNRVNHNTQVVNGSGKTPTTLQPYITVYFWRRTA